MLNTLTVWNFALLEHVQIEFDKGLNILTGETGAGKSILIDALGAMLGRRLTTDMIRTSCDWMRIEAVFRLEKQPRVEEFLHQQLINIDGDELIITRQITAAGRGTILINGSHVTLAVLKRLGTMLVDIHGQNENLSLLKQENQLELVDGSNQELLQALAKYRELYRVYRKVCQELHEKKSACQDYLQRQDMLRWQLQEIETAQLQEGEDEELQRRIDKMTNGEKISRYGSNACQMLYGGAGNIGVISGLEEAVESLHGLSRFDDSLDNIIDILGGAVVQIKEAGYELRDYVDALEFDSHLLDQLQGRMDVIDKLCKKYGADVKAVLQYGEKCRQELDSMANYYDDIIILEQQLQEAKRKAEQEAEKISALRQKTADKLSQAIENHLQALGMANAKFQIQATAGEELTANGCDKLEILFSANPGQESRSIQKVASGGELSRIALAIKTVTANRDGSPASMVFDEIDTGIGGRTAQMVAERIAMVAAHRQVLCITHLPQIACMADIHLYISKHVIDNKTSTVIHPLTTGERVNEIARMASGANVSSASLDNAREMIAYASRKKEEYKKHG